MSWLHGLTHRVRVVLRAGSYDSELDEEMRLHRELDAMQQGDGARARHRFGNDTYYREEARRMTWLGFIDTVRQDAGYAWRGITRTPGVTSVVVVMLALGLGVNAAMFTLLDRLYLRAPAGVAEPSTVQRVWTEHFRTADGVPFTMPHVNYPMYRAIADATGDAARVSLYATDYSLRVGRGLSGTRVRGVYATWNYFAVLGLRPALGRFYSADEDRLGDGAAVAVISYGFWQRQFGGDSAVVGQPLDLGSNTYTIIGVAARSFTGLELQAADVWIPLASWPAPSWAGKVWWESVNMYPFRAVRRTDDTSDDAFEQRASVLVRQLERELRPKRPDTLMNVYAGSIIEARGPGRPGQELVISTRLGGVAVIVLLIACANVINLLLARAMSRRRETAVRLALGISRWRLVRQLTAETVLLSAIAAVAALMTGWMGGTLLRSLLLPDVEWFDSVLDVRVALFTAGIALLAGVTAGIVPALQSSKPDLARELKAGARDGVRHRSRLRSTLVVAQAALSVVLLVGATLFVRSLRNVQGLDIGYDASRLIFGSVAFAEGDAPPPAVVAAAMRDVAQRLESRPGIQSVARTAMRPMSGWSSANFYFGADSSRSFGPNAPTFSAVSPSFFRTAGIAVLRGRGFSAGDIDGAPAELVVNDAAAKLVWPGRDAIGECVRFGSQGSPCYAVVGVVENARRARVIEETPAAQFYLQLGNQPSTTSSGTTLIVRTDAKSAGAATAELRAELQRAMPNAAANVSSMNEALEPEYRPWRLGATLFTAFGLLALLVAIVGIYTTVSYGVTQRTHEFGVRIALGARIGDVLRQVIAEGIGTVVIGLVVGVALALAAGRLIATLLYGIEPSDPLTFLVVSMTLLVVAVFAALIPAWRAARVDPLTALRVD